MEGLARLSGIRRVRLVFDVHRGETYLVVCTLKDNPATQPHIMFGMYGSFRVE